MLNYILKFIVAISILIFFWAMLFKKGDKNIFFILYIIILYPFIRINLIPSLLELSLFDFLVLIFFFFFYKRRTGEKDSNGFLSFSIIILMSTILIGFIAFNDFTLQSAEMLIQFLSISLFSKILFEELRHKRAMGYELIEKLKIPIIFSFIFLACQLIVGVQFSISKQLNTNILSEVVVRYPSYFQDPQKFSQFLAASSFLMLIDTKRNKTKTITGITIAITAIICIFFTGGRAGLTGCIIGMIVLGILGTGQYRKMLLISILLIAGVAIFFSNQFSIFQRESLNESYSFRMSIWKSAYDIFTNHPIMGIGAGNYPNYVSIHNPDQFWVSENEIVIYDHPESGYLKLLVEFGLIGFFSIISIILIPIVKGVCKYVKTKNIHILLYICAILSWMVGFYSVYSLGDVRITVLISIIVCMLISETKYEKFHTKI